MKRVAMCWSGGKDSAWTLHKLVQDPEVVVVRLVTVIEQGGDNVILTMLNRRLIREQGKLLNLPPLEVGVAGREDFGEYFELPQSCINTLVDDGVTHIAFGDLSDEQTRKAREEDLESSGLDPLFPLWGRKDAELADEIIAGGVKAYVVSVDSAKVDPGLLGRRFDKSFVAQLGPEVNKCGEFEEFHTFVYDSPEFSKPLKVIPGDRVRRGSRWTIELFHDQA